MAKMRPWTQRFFDFITSKNTGDVVTDAEILAATSWEPATLRTHRDKNALEPFLEVIGPGKSRVRRDGGTISKNAINEAFTQIRTTPFVLSRGAMLSASLGNYELVEELGRGAVAHVWKARRVLNNQMYAAKIMNPRADLLDPKVIDDVKRRFSREARNGPNVTHENIVAYSDYGEYDTHPFLVMELADDTLGARLATKLLTVDESIKAVRACARGLQYLHSKQSPHRDVKPHNILRFGDRYVLGDLGIVKWSDMNPEFTSAGTITKDSLQLGSWFYMAPEQRTSAKDATPACDVYALGVSWFQMLTGKTSDPAEIAAQAFADPSTSPAVNSMIRRMLQYKPSERPTVEDLLEFLDKASA